MKYRTLIELICNASDKEDAINTAGDYLKGEIDFGVEMRCKTVSLWAHQVKKYSAAGIAVVMVFSALLFKVTPIASNEKTGTPARPSFHNTCTITPALKTKHRADFKQEWDEKKEEAMLEYLKK